MKLTLFLLLTFIGSNTALASKNDYCQKSSVTKLFLGQDDICLKQAELLTENEKKILSRLQKIHSNVASLFELPIEDLITRDLNITIEESVYSFIPSAASGNSIFIGVSPNTHFDFNTAVYIHELTHWMLYYRGSKISNVIQDLNESISFSETISDLVAFSIEGVIISPSVESPSCLDKIRYITSSQSYNLPKEYFNDFSEGRIFKCCESILKSSHDENLINLCSEVSQWVKPISISKVPFHSGQTGTDEHQIGIPLISFLKNFSKQSGTAFKTLFKNIFLKESKTQRTLSCHSIDFKWSKEVHTYTLGQALKSFEDSLEGHTKRIFEELKLKHAITKAYDFHDLEIIKHYKKLALEEYLAEKPECSKIKNCLLSCNF